MSPSIIPPRVFDVSDRAVALVSAQPLALMPSFPPPKTQVDGNAQPPLGVEMRAASLATLPPEAPKAAPALDKDIEEAEDRAPAASSAVSRVEGPWKGRMMTLVGALILIAIAAIVLLTWRGPTQATPHPLQSRPSSQPNALAGAGTTEHSTRLPPTSHETPAKVLSLPTPTVRFHCDPEGCDAVYCDGKELQATQAPIPLKSGTHTCKAMKAGFRTVAQRFTLRENESVKKTFLQGPRSPTSRQTPVKASQFPLPQDP